MRLSFLNDDGALQNTLDFLKSSGCETDANGGFRRAVERYNSTALQLDLSRFPAAQHGFYSFQSSSQLLAAIPHGFFDVPHPFEFNCFDTVILLGSAQLRANLHPDDQRGGFLAQGLATNRQLLYAHASTAGEAFNLSYPAWYRDASDGYFPSSMADSRICLTAAFYCFHMLPASTASQDVGGQVINILRESWKNQAIEFPSRFQIVLCHQVNLTNHLFATTHAGLLFPIERGYIYIEKSAGVGPFVRLDFGDKADLMAWLALKFDQSMGDHVFVTFNNSKIEMLDVGH